MRRRTFISLLGVIAVTGSARAQNPRQRRVGVLMQGGGAHLAGLEGLRLESVWKIGLRWGFVWGLAVIQALDVDRAEPWPDGQDREEDQALLV